MSDAQLVAAALAVLAFTAAILLYYLPIDRCPYTCGYCRDQQAKADAERKAAHTAAQHDAMHRGFGVSRRPVDLYDCDDPQCPRNRRQP